MKELEADLGFKALSPVWAKLEIFGGLACVWLSFRIDQVAALPPDSVLVVLASLGLFVLGGYLAMAGSRSHMYQSNNRLAAYVISRSKPL
ncbi:MAG TPA: hypothetical protein VF595_11545 [Tepidisphaeraceae bacterium]